MAVLISTNKTKKKYRLYSTIADGWLTEWISKEEAIKELQSRAKNRCREECEKIAQKFPIGYYKKEDSKPILEEPF